MAKAGFVTIIGRPNVGKSTLMNTLIGQKIAITSYKPQTTRNQIRTIYTDERGQIVFLDTPGMHKENDRLGEYMLKAASATLSEVDVILWLVEARRTTGKARGHRQEGSTLQPQSGESAGLLPLEEQNILKELVKASKPVIIVITKCDTLPKEAILPLIALYSQAWQTAVHAEKTGTAAAGDPAKEYGTSLTDDDPAKESGTSLTDDISAKKRGTAPADNLMRREKAKDTASQVDIIPVSARTRQGCDDLMDTIFRKLPEGEPFYDADEITTQTQRQIAAEIIREKALRLLQEEVPHGIAVQITKMHTRKGSSGVPVCDMDADIICEREAHKGIIIGAKGAMLKKIGTQARQDIEKMLETKVNLQLFVKVRKNWKDDEKTLRALGYNVKELE